MKGLLSAAILIALSAPACAAGVTVSDAWFRSLPAGLPAGGYMVLHNAGEKDAVLTGAASPACGAIMLHQSENMNGMSGMTMTDTVTIPARGQFVFKPGGYHLMCMQPAMKIGTAVTVTLTFAGGAKITASFAVKNARGT